MERRRRSEESRRQGQSIRDLIPQSSARGPCKRLLPSTLLRVPAMAPKQLLYPAPWSGFQWDLPGWGCWNSFLSLSYPSGHLHKLLLTEITRVHFYSLQFVSAYCSEWANVACYIWALQKMVWLEWQARPMQMYVRVLLYCLMLPAFPSLLLKQQCNVIQQKLLSFLMGTNENLKSPRVHSYLEQVQPVCVCMPVHAPCLADTLQVCVCNSHFHNISNTACYFQGDLW